MDKDDIIKFKEYLQEREMIEKEMNMKMLFEEFMEDMRRKKMMEKRDMIADGGRVLKQTGGITETRTLPPEYIEAAQKTFFSRSYKTSWITKCYNSRNTTTW